MTGLRSGRRGVRHRAAPPFAEYASARPDRLARMPANLTFEQAAAVPVSAITALQALRDRGRVQAGQHVLVIGASGGVGTFAVQIAKAFGATVTGVCSTAKVDLVRSLGADHVIDYTQADITDDGQRYDLVLDIGGNRPLSQLRRVLTREGRWSSSAAKAAAAGPAASTARLGAMVLSPFVRQRLGTFIAKPNRADLDTLRALIETGAVTPVIDRVVALRPGPGGDPRPRRRTRARQDRHRALTPDPNVSAQPTQPPASAGSRISRPPRKHGGRPEPLTIR